MSLIEWGLDYHCQNQKKEERKNRNNTKRPHMDCNDYRKLSVVSYLKKLLIITLKSS